MRPSQGLDTGPIPVTRSRKFMLNEQQIEQEFENIKQRNRRVEADKAWEVSKTRRGFIAVTTYLVASIWLIVIRDGNPFLKALIPMVGYLLSTLSLPIIKKIWLSKYNNQ